ncbi:hypothetical protein PsorP6_010008 [Peronosclerospora sorghi]|uniref:Uncharacterized protein n=1 Tax=Peronosclerospora sorghi TaxID=230839 RepID=A0ACC0VW95_9STRA|nr:hypothetical protein PsorP6_010008 [Peronosclerospora sorghi]
MQSRIHHLGKSIDEGHYAADVCDSRIQRNDTYESEISEDYALQSSRSQRSCYMFFYVLILMAMARKMYINVALRLRMKTTKIRDRNGNKLQVVA